MLGGVCATYVGKHMADICCAYNWQDLHDSTRQGIEVNDMANCAFCSTFDMAEKRLAFLMTAVSRKGLSHVDNLYAVKN